MHELVLVSVHTRERTDMSKNVLQCVRKLERIDIAETVLNVSIDNEFRETQDLSTQMKRVSETRLLTLLGGQCPGRC